MGERSFGHRRNPLTLTLIATMSLIVLPHKPPRGVGARQARATMMSIELLMGVFYTGMGLALIIHEMMK